MKRTTELLRRLLPFILALLIISAGLFVPWWLIQGKKNRIAKTSASMGSRELAVYQSLDANGEILAKRVAQISGALIGSGGGTFEKNNSQEPLGMELDRKAALTHVQEIMKAIFDTMHQFNPAIQLEEPISEENSEVLLRTCMRDRELSAWFVWCKTDVVVLDALSGLPLELHCRLYDDIPPEAVYLAAARAYNHLYGDMLGGFSEEPELRFKAGDGLLLCGTSGPFYLTTKLDWSSCEITIQLTAKAAEFDSSDTSR